MSESSKQPEGKELQILSDSDLARRTQRFVVVAVVFLFAASLLCVLLAGMAGPPEQAGTGSVRIHDPGQSSGPGVEPGTSGTPGTPGNPGDPTGPTGPTGSATPGGHESSNGTVSQSVQAHYKPVFDKLTSAEPPRERASLEMEGKVLEW